jgi:tetratricopeptide (TPR) repeat protein
MRAFWNIVAPLLSLTLFIASVGWVLYRTVKRSHDPAQLIARWILSAIVIGGTLWFLVKSIGFGTTGSSAGDYGKAFIIAGSAATCGILLAILWASSIGEAFARPLAGIFDGGSAEIEPQPCYSAAESRRKRGLYLEAIAQIQLELDKFPGDLTGTLLLADIHARNLRDTDTAIQILETWITSWGASSSRLPSAFHQLADIHLLLRNDPDSARASLERIQQHFPNTEAAHLAAQRIAHLASREMLADKAQPHRINLGTYEQRVGLQRNPAPSLAPQENPATVAANYVRHLEQFPEDDEVRERLARIYAEHFQRMDLAREEFDRLMSRKSASTRQMARWLNLLADAEIHCADNPDGARAALQRIIDRFPQTASAENAKHRLSMLTLESRGKRKTITVPLPTAQRQQND